MRLVHHGAVGQVPRDAWWSIAQQLGTDDAAHAVGPDQGIALNDLAGARTYGDHAILFHKALHSLLKIQMDLGQMPYSLQQQGMQVRTVDRGINRAIAVHGLLTQW